MTPSSTEGEAGSPSAPEAASKAGETAGVDAIADTLANGLRNPAPHGPPPMPAKKGPSGNPRAFDRFRGGSKFHGGKGNPGGGNYLRKHMNHGRGS
jgi:hypothetical protein